MSRPRAVLRQPESYPKSRLPPGVQPLKRPPALGRAIELAFLRWEKQQLKPTEAFWRDFGMHIVSSSPERLVARGAGPAPCIAIAVRGTSDRFVGPAFRMSVDTDLDRYVAEVGARWLESEMIPGGGRGIELSDPSGRSVWLLQGQSELNRLPVREALVASTTPLHAPRVNRTVRAPIEPARVMKLGHVVFQTVDFPRMADWYLRVLGLIPTDVQYLPDGSPNLAFCRLDLGEQPADHHTFVLVGGIEEKYEHSAYEVVDRMRWSGPAGAARPRISAHGHRAPRQPALRLLVRPRRLRIRALHGRRSVQCGFRDRHCRWSLADLGVVTMRRQMKPKKNLRNLARARLPAARPSRPSA
jgi:catechol 2,3-dioxygenase-like lactoylglutathione lyase family enzyme